jgi:hypothetical protein
MADQPEPAEIHLFVVAEALLDRDTEPSSWRHQQQVMKVQASIAKDERTRRPIPLVDRQVGDVEQCPGSGAKRKTSPRDEYFAFDPKRLSSR